MFREEIIIRDEEFKKGIFGDIFCLDMEKRPEQFFEELKDHRFQQEKRYTISFEHPPAWVTARIIDEMKKIPCTELSVKTA